MHSSRGISIVVLILVLLVGAAVMGWIYYDSIFPPTEPEEPGGGGVGLANPAAVYCVDELKGQTKTHQVAGGEAGYCILPDGRECEEWVLFQSKGESCVNFVAEQDFTDEETCNEVCTAANYNKGECITPDDDQIGTGYNNVGPCQITGSYMCSGQGACNCYCHQ